MAHQNETSRRILADGAVVDPRHPTNTANTAAVSGGTVVGVETKITRGVLADGAIADPEIAIMVVNAPAEVCEIPADIAPLDCQRAHVVDAATRPILVEAV